MAMGKGGLGKGLEALFPSNVDVNNLGQTIKSTDEGVIELKLNEIEPDIFWFGPILFIPVPILPFAAKLKAFVAFVTGSRQK